MQKKLETGTKTRARPRKQKKIYKGPKGYKGSGRGGTGTKLKAKPDQVPTKEKILIGFKGNALFTDYKPIYASTKDKD